MRCIGLRKFARRTECQTENIPERGPVPGRARPAHETARQSRQLRKSTVQAMTATIFSRKDPRLSQNSQIQISSMFSYREIYTRPGAFGRLAGRFHRATGLRSALDFLLSSCREFSASGSRCYNDFGSKIHHRGYGQPFRYMRISAVRL